MGRGAAAAGCRRAALLKRARLLISVRIYRMYCSCVVKTENPSPSHALLCSALPPVLRKIKMWLLIHNS